MFSRVGYIEISQAVIFLIKKSLNLFVMINFSKPTSKNIRRNPCLINFFIFSLHSRSQVEQQFYNYRFLLGRYLATFVFKYVRLPAPSLVLGLSILSVVRSVHICLVILSTLRQDYFYVLSNLYYVSLQLHEAVQVHP